VLRARAYIRSHERLTLFLLLSFALGVLRPGLTSFAHHHPGGEHSHLHLDGAPARPAAAIAGARNAAAAGAPAGERVLAAAGTHGLHTHLLASFALARLPDLPAAAGAPGRVTTVALPAPARVRAGAVRAGQARAPPALPA
jgi:hypothetical protein